MGRKYAVFPQNTELDHKKKYKTKSVLSVYDDHEGFVFWGDTQTIKEQFQTLNCSQLSVRIYNIDRDSYDWLEKAETREGHLPKQVIMESLYKGD